MLAALSMQEIQARVSAPEVVMSNKRGPTLRGEGIVSRTHNNYSIKLDQDLRVNEMGGIIVLWENQDGIVESRFLVGADGKGPDPFVVRSS